MTLGSDDESDEEVVRPTKKPRYTQPESDVEEWKDDVEMAISSSDDDVDEDAATANSESESAGEAPNTVDDEDDEEIVDFAQLAKPKPASRPRRPAAATTVSRTGLDLSLPPVSRIDDIFLDLTSRALKLGLEKAVQSVGTSSIRVATMCSGTEAPLLSFQLVNKALAQLGHSTFSVEHVFSAEIEPFKQAYIERNFRPPLLFRDILEFISSDKDVDPELGPKATTVYGSKVYVPGNIDVLVAGSSCVDNSALNIRKKTIDEQGTGESSQTFFAVLGYAKRVQPGIVILENVINDKAWTVYEAQFRKIGYATQIVKADTKNFYIPHTRQRKYMICLNRKAFGAKAEDAVAQWGSLMVSLERRASAPVTSFLLANDDVRYKIMQGNSWSKEAVARLFEWEACRGRHELARMDEGLGPRRPVTGILLDWADRMIKKRPERDQEVIDIEYLKAAKGGTDNLYKTRVMDLSQNVDRQGKAANGITGCLTPRGYPFITDQCRPLSGYENLQLQGIPIDEVLFTSESDVDLKDLAGNAMSSTVVGAALIAALIVGYRGIKNDRAPHTTEIVEQAAEFRLKGLEELIEVPAAEERAEFQISTILQEAVQSSRLCSELCEGKAEISKSRILRCTSCGHTACAHCAGSPQHNYVEHKNSRQRMLPDLFEKRWRRAFPIQVELSNLPDFESLFETVDEDIRQNFTEAVRDALTDTVFTFAGLNRGREWTALYVAERATLELRLSTTPKWSIFIDPAANLSAGSRLRHVLQRPVASAQLGDSIENMAHSWQWSSPNSEKQKVQLSFQGSGNKVRSWRAILGLTEFSEEEVWEALEISTDEDGWNAVTGSYVHLPKCGTACSSLYVRNEGDKSMYLFLDPDSIGDSSRDSVSSTCLYGYNVLIHHSSSSRPTTPA